MAYTAEPGQSAVLTSHVQTRAERGVSIHKGLVRAHRQDTRAAASPFTLVTKSPYPHIKAIIQL